MAKTIIVRCSECNKPITMTSSDAHLCWRFNGGFPLLNITVDCPHCRKPSIVHESPEAHDLLDGRIKSKDYDEEDLDPIAGAFWEELN